MIALAALLSIHVFAFDGGTVYELLQKVSSEQHTAVALMYAPPFSSFGPPKEPILDRFQFQYLDQPQLILRIARKLETNSQGRKQFAFAPDASIDMMNRMIIVNQPGGSSEPWPDKPNEDGTITLKCKDRPFRLSELSQGLWPKPVKISPLFLGATVVLQAESAAPEQVFRLIAATVGAKPIFSDKEWRLGFDAKEYRRRAAATLDLRLADTRHPEPNLLRSTVELCKASLDLMTDEELEEDIENKQEKRFVVPPLSPIMSLVKARLAAYSHAQFGGETPGVTHDGSQIVQMLDMSRPIEVVVRPQTLGVFLCGKVKNKETSQIQF